MLMTFLNFLETSPHDGRNKFKYNKTKKTHKKIFGFVYNNKNFEKIHGTLILQGNKLLPHVTMNGNYHYGIIAPCGGDKPLTYIDNGQLVKRIIKCSRGKEVPWGSGFNANTLDKIPELKQTYNKFVNFLNSKLRSYNRPTILRLNKQNRNIKPGSTALFNYITKASNDKKRRENERRAKRNANVERRRNTTSANIKTLKRRQREKKKLKTEQNKKVKAARKLLRNKRNAENKKRRNEERLTPEQRKKLQQRSHLIQDIKRNGYNFEFGNEYQV